MKLKIFLLRFGKKFFFKLTGIKKKYSLKRNYDELIKGQDAADLIFDVLNSEKPCMIARFGSVELDAMDYVRYKKQSFWTQILHYFKNESNYLEDNNCLFYSLENNAGFYPINKQSVVKFYDTMLQSMNNLDVLGGWLYKELNFTEQMKNVKIVRRGDLEPFYHEKPWSLALKGKRVLVVHPFVNTIKSQYSNREKLFKDENILPEFELKLYKPVESFAGNSSSLAYESWFEALEKMKNEIKGIDFDIAILGCGAYGFPLASYIKEIGKKSVHIGGATQLLFGITGKRWEEEYDMSNIINENWVRPFPEDISVDINKVENGCYW